MISNSRRDLTYKDIFKYYNHAQDSRPASWLMQRCNGEKRTLNSIIPNGFESYLRVPHPAWTELNLEEEEVFSDNAKINCSQWEKLYPVSWRTIAKLNSRKIYGHMLWHEIYIYPAVAAEANSIEEPKEGELPRCIVEKIFNDLIRFNGKDTEIYCGFWRGAACGYAKKATAQFKRRIDDQVYNLLKTKIFRLRDSFFSAHKHSLESNLVGTDGTIPNIFWPFTNEWCVVSDFNLTSTYIGGPKNLVSRIASAADIESYEVFAGDKII